MELNFIPNYSYKIKIVGYILLTFSLIYILLSKVFDFTLINNDLTLWTIAFSLLIISFSKGKKHSKNIVLIKYYSGKITASFIFSFILAVKLTEFIVEKTLSIDTILLVIIALSVYQISYNVINIIERKNNITLKEANVFETIINNKRLFFISLIIAIMTLVLIVLI
ncbi:MAG: hypothetical protein KGY74_09940 [Candidatus Cloacimonetes bacterium]|nr:hypothetical protein [Candidatus Cloacimonadota bacterium]